MDKEFRDKLLENGNGTGKKMLILRFSYSYYEGFEKYCKEHGKNYRIDKESTDKDNVVVICTEQLIKEYQEVVREGLRKKK